MKIILVGATGLRRSEICGLRWCDIDLDAGMFQVQRSVQRVKGQGLVVMDTKTRKSKRMIGIGLEAILRMRQHRIAQAEAKSYAGPAWIDGDFVFTRPDGRPLDPDMVSHAFHEVMLAMGLDSARLHDTRHTHATILFARGYSTPDDTRPTRAQHNRHHKRHLHSHGTWPTERSGGGD